MIPYAHIQFPPARHLWGTRLPALQLGHMFALERIGSPFVSPLAPSGERAGVRGLPGLADLLNALDLCSRPCWVKNPTRFQLRCLRLRVALRTVRHSIFTLRWRPRWGVWTVPEGELLDACIAFASHLRAAQQMPDIVPPEHTSKDIPGTPWLAAVKVKLRTALRCSEAEALRTPLVLALFDTTAAREDEGRLFIDDLPAELHARMDAVNRAARLAKDDRGEKVEERAASVASLIYPLSSILSPPSPPLAP